MFAHKDSSVTADGVFLFIALAKLCLFVSCVTVLLWLLFPVDFASPHTLSVLGILYQRGLVLRILDFPLSKYESCSQKVKSINNLSSNLYGSYKTYFSYPQNYHQPPWTTKGNPKKELWG